ncbi:MAG: helix-turn-helix transcriptional regulator [Colwellia sp.]|nr:helix-turn-helix transcriptional regulator [Colwellia sp.]
MENLISTLKEALDEKQPLPYAVYSSIKEQKILNVPVVKPLFIAVLSGNKALGRDGEISCTTGDFIFLSNNAAIDMRNIPKDNEYLALLIEFEYQDFEGLEVSHINQQNYCVGKITATLEMCLQQFIEWSRWAPEALWPIRRKELIQLMCYLGHKEILSMVASPQIGHKLHALFTDKHSEKSNDNHSGELTITSICQQLAMSESTLRRKLKSEGLKLQDIKDQVKLGLGLHLLQSTLLPISYIAQKCGYHSQSRFTSRFKDRFGLTPSTLRKTRLAD